MKNKTLRYPLAPASKARCAQQPRVFDGIARPPIDAFPAKANKRKKGKNKRAKKKETKRTRGQQKQKKRRNRREGRRVGENAIAEFRVVHLRRRRGAGRAFYLTGNQGACALAAGRAGRFSRAALLARAPRAGKERITQSRGWV